jgi:hypothetical protein
MAPAGPKGSTAWTGIDCRGRFGGLAMTNVNMDLAMTNVNMGLAMTNVNMGFAMTRKGTGPRNDGFAGGLT